MNNEVEICRRKRSSPSLRQYPGICLGGLMKATQNICKISRSSSPDLNVAPPEYEEALLTTWKLLVVMRYGGRGPGRIQLFCGFNNLLVTRLFRDASDIALTTYRRMVWRSVSRELEGSWKKSAVTHVQIRCQELPETTTENWDTPQTGKRVSNLSFDPGTYQIQAQVLTTQP